MDNSKNLPWELQTAWQLSPNLCLRPQKNLVLLHPALARLSAEGLCIHMRIPSIAPAQHSKLAADFFGSSLQLLAVAQGQLDMRFEIQSVH